MEHVLVGYATRHGATRGIAERIGTRLRDAGLEADVRPVSAVRDLPEFAACAPRQDRVRSLANERR